MANEQEPAEFTDECLIGSMDHLQELVNIGQINIPSDYSIVNACRAAYFIIRDINSGKNDGYKPALQYCTNKSIGQALLQMVTDGLTPAKSQCYFVMRKAGGKYVLNYGQEYQGRIALAKRFSGVKRVDAQVVYKKDKYTVTVIDGIKKVTHETSLENINFDEMTGAYAVVTEEDGTKQTFEMSMEQIKLSWEQGPMKGNGDVHKNFKDQMAIKTICNRATKGYVNTSNDEAVIQEDKLLVTNQESKQLESPKKQIAPPPPVQKNEGIEEAKVVDEKPESKDPAEF